MTWDAKRMEIATKVKTLIDAGFSKKDIIEAAKSKAIDELTKG